MNDHGDHGSDRAAGTGSTAVGPLGLSPQLWEVLACPCPRHESVTPDVEASVIRCVACDTTFPVRDGIPVMLLDEATPGPQGIGGAGARN
jgi:uncharacterized protein YbaR (Trm112 family)